MATNTALLITALMNQKVPDGLIPGIVDAVSKDWPGSKMVLNLMDEVVANAASPDVVRDILLRIEEVATLPQGITATIEWLKTTGAPDMQIAQVIAIVASAVHDAESWLTQHLPA